MYQYDERKTKIIPEVFLKIVVEFYQNWFKNKMFAKVSNQIIGHQT